jgi:metallo-beta-lactamase family protein
MSITVQFLGAAGTVTGSKYLVSSNSHQFLVDSGMFQGPREWREKNWIDPLFDPKKIDAVFITHAHIDHIGYLPRLVKRGLKCPIYLTHASQDLAELLLIDSAELQEEEASFRNQHGYSRHTPPQPLYTVGDARETIKLLEGVDFHKPYQFDGIESITWNRVGHILGAGSISLKIQNKSLQFSGDLGRYGTPIMPDPEPIEFGDLLLIESTYGSRRHKAGSPKDLLAEVINKTIDRGGMVLIPSFAVGRTQEILYYLRELKDEGKISNVPIVIDSPMAIDATKIYAKHPECYDKEAVIAMLQGEKIFTPDNTRFVRDRSASIHLNSVHEPMILISASGMLSGGRILHHIKLRITDKRNTLLFVGFQPEGGTGAWIKSGAKTVRLLGEEVSVRAEIAEISSLSAHGDCEEMLRWCRECTGFPKKVAVIHGETDSANAFAARLKKEFGWDTFVPRFQELVKVT